MADLRAERGTYQPYRPGAPRPGDGPKNEMIAEFEQRMEHLEEQHQTDREAIEFFERETDRVRVHRVHLDEYYECYPDAVIEYADELHEAKESRTKLQQVQTRILSGSGVTDSSSRFF